jgi:RNA ligase (TIGR02306 family)
VSTLKVEVVAIDEILTHPNADRLELARVKGWNVVVGKGSFKAGDTAVYFPVDSVLPEDLERDLFPAGSKITLHKHRIRSIKIRGAMSQGMLVQLVQLFGHFKADSSFISKFRGKEAVHLEVGDDLTEALGVTKYEPPEPEFNPKPSKWGIKTGGKAQINPNFKKYTDIENAKNFHTVFQPGEMVYISEKLHGTSARYGYVPRFHSGMFGFFKRFFMKMGWMSQHEFVYGSRNVQLQTGSNHPWYTEDVYKKILVQEDLKSKLKEGECVYGEIVGDRIQKNYSYGCKEGEHAFYAYDVMVDGKWLDHADFAKFCDERRIKRVPELYVGPYSKEVEMKHRDGDSTIGGQKIREGIVMKPLVEAVDICGRKVLKSISDAYYLEDNSDFH